MINIWIWFFGLILTQTLYFSILNNNLDSILECKFIFLSIFLYVLIFSSILEYVTIRTFKGSEGEAFFTAILSLGTTFLYQCIVENLKTNKINSKNHGD